MAFFPRYCSSDFAPLFQLLDDYDVHQTTHRPNKKVTTVRTFAPKFDVYELNDRYFLDGELPGVEQNDVDIEFSDPQTLVIKGRSQRNYHKEKHPESDDGSETSSVKSHQPTVEDWDEMIDATPTTEATPAPTAEENTAEKSRPEPGYKFWASERSVGEFHRTFAFPTRVDQESVKASLKNGILSVVLPKEPAPQLKKVRVQ